MFSHYATCKISLICQHFLKTSVFSTLGATLIRKKCQFPRFPSFQFCPISKIKNLEISESFLLLHFLAVYETQNLKTKKWPKTKKTLTWRCGLIRKKCPFQRFLIFQFFSVFEIENLKTSESFDLLQIFIVLVALSIGKVKTFH